MSESLPIATLNESGFDDLVRYVQRLVQDQSQRLIVGIAGFPGSGKSTFAAQFVQCLNMYSDNSDLPFAVYMPMDGFHYTNAEIERHHLTGQKGSPPTFDARAYIDLIRHAANPTASFYFPHYDRTLHEPVYSKTDPYCLKVEHRIVITEGNYLLVEHPPWRELGEILSEAWFLDVPRSVCEHRLLKRHMAGGRDFDQAMQQIRKVDRPNMNLIDSSRKQPDRILRWS
ncbi:hypothetical protein [Poriferisphaera sp. WC338]|uniref:hypothetical protein n=1 Tax=Poriferisphaera sp. WC338 TaxID=3425129 RepID=UPI003D8142C5